MKDFFLKASHKKIWYFTHSARNGICFCKMDSNVISDFELLQRDALSDYSAIIDDNDIVHIACQNSDGDIIYLRNTEKGWNKYTILKSRTKESYPKNFRVIASKSLIHMFYNVKSADRMLLTHHIIDGQKFEPVALDYISGSFFCCIDSSETIYLFYRCSDSDVFGCRIFDQQSGLWSSYIALENTKGVNVNQFFIDLSGNLHIVGVADSNVVYIRVSDFTTHPLDDSESKLHDQSSVELNTRRKDDHQMNRSLKFGRGHTPLILSCSGRLFVMWNFNEKVRAFCSSDLGLNWQPNEFVSGRRMPVMLFGLSYTKYESIGSDIRASSCFGYIFENVVYLYALGKFFEVKPSLPEPDIHPQFQQGQQFNKEKKVLSMRDETNIKEHFFQNGCEDSKIQQQGRVHYFKSNGIENQRVDDFEIMRREFENELKLKFAAKNGSGSDGSYNLNNYSGNMYSQQNNPMSEDLFPKESSGSDMDLVKLKILIETYLGRCDKLERMIESIISGVNRSNELVSQLRENTETLLLNKDKESEMSKPDKKKKRKKQRKSDKKDKVSEKEKNIKNPPEDENYNDDDQKD